MANAPKGKPTYADYERMRDEGHAVEWIGGEIVEKAMPSPEHGSAQGKVVELLGPFNRRSGGPRGPGGWWLMTEVEVRYAINGEVYRHDVLGFRRDVHPARPTGMPVVARPDWVCEILSSSNARRDIVTKQRTLHANAVPYYWLLDPEREVLTVLRWSQPAYHQLLTAEIGEVVRAEPFDAIEISITELFGRDD
jgi:Uma2 family endonuclease